MQWHDQLVLVLVLHPSVKKVSTDTVVLTMGSLFYTTVIALYLSIKKLSTVALSISSLF